MDFRSFGGKKGKASATLTPTNSFLLLGFLHLCKIWRKSICDFESAHRRIHTLTDVNKFYNLSHAIFFICGLSSSVGLCRQEYKSTCSNYDLCHPG